MNNEFVFRASFDVVRGVIIYNLMGDIKEEPMPPGMVEAMTMSTIIELTGEVLMNAEIND